MSWKTRKREAGLEHVVIPGRDPMPPAGTSLLDKQGRLWRVIGDRVYKMEGDPLNGHWDGPRLAELGALVIVGKRSR